MILAGIDIGTNTLRLLIADAGPESFREIHSAGKITRLGEHLDRTGELSSRARERTISALASFREITRQFPTARLEAVGTSALRNARNAASFVAAVRDQTGIDVRVISGEEEAKLTLLGVIKSLRSCPGFDPAKPATPIVVIDIGGGSTEIMIAGPIGEPQAVSLPLGAVYLTERFLSLDPPPAAQIHGLHAWIRGGLDVLTGLTDRVQGAALVGTAGTITTLAAINRKLTDYDPDKVHCSTLASKDIERITEQLRGMTFSERREVAGLEQGREDIILAGALVCREIMQKLNFPSLLVSDWGLREGIIFDLYGKMGKAGSRV